MIKERRQPFTRKLGDKRYKKLFLVAVEGECTEREYFEECVGPLTSELIHVEISCGKTRTSPAQTLRRVKTAMKKRSLKKQDEVWIVVDVDDWKQGDLETLIKWASSHPNRGVAVSKPNFEYWLLLHFEDGADLSGTNDLNRRLGVFLPNYKKHINRVDFSIQQIKNAISRAENKDRSSEYSALPQTNGSQVYKLVKAILSCIIS